FGTLVWVPRRRAECRTLGNGEFGFGEGVLSVAGFVGGEAFFERVESCGFVVGDGLFHAYVVPSLARIAIFLGRVCGGSEEGFFGGSVEEIIHDDRGEIGCGLRVASLEIGGEFAGSVGIAATGADEPDIYTWVILVFRVKFAQSSEGVQGGGPIMEFILDAGAVLAGIEMLGIEFECFVEI